ncbi:hypothetical protein ACFT9I_22410 [Streptomyces sp. NPDC057137]|uniref:hypothetical protein n=1 Tax=Streptomyces sp. NPDC057137 TaxID=3346030 RepID=UPI003638E107
MGRFPKPDDCPEMVVGFVRRTVELPEGTLPLYETGRTEVNTWIRGPRGRDRPHAPEAPGGHR